MKKIIQVIVNDPTHLNGYGVVEIDPKHVPIEIACKSMIEDGVKYTHQDGSIIMYPPQSIIKITISDNYYADLE